MTVTAPTAGDTISDDWTAGVSDAINRAQAGVNDSAATSGTDTTTSASYVNLAGTGAVTSFSFTKRESDTRVKVFVAASATSAGSNSAVMFGVRIDGTDYDVVEGAFGGAGDAKTFVGVAFVSGVAAGTYTVQGRWKRTVGSGTPTRTATNDWLTIVCEEVT